MIIDKEGETLDYQIGNNSEYKLRFNLTKRQQEVSRKILENVLKGESVLVNAVTGAGKTELVYKTIKHFVTLGKKVGIAIARRQVVMQLYARLHSDFPNLKIVRVCQGYTKDILGDIVICTTHQLFRYYRYFDLLIIDEPDAYPFTGNQVLHGIAKTSCKGQNVYLTATPDKWLKDMVERNEVVEINLPCRPSNRPLPLPLVYYDFEIIMFYKLAKIIKEQNTSKRATLFYFPTIKMMEFYAFIFKKFYQIETISSKTKNKDEVIFNFLNKKYLFLFSTTILERGVTFPFIDLVVYHGEHVVFTESVLIQIIGRIQRDVNDTKGKGIILANRRSVEIRKCIENIKEKNRLAFGVDVI